MSSRFWASLEDLSVDSSFDGNLDGSRDDTRDQQGHQGAEATVNSLSNGDIRTVARSLTTNTRANVQSQQQATLLLLSLVEGRCKTQAAKVMNRSRRPADQLPEDHHDIHHLSKRLFIAATNDLIQAGIIPEEFAGRQLSELQSYLSAFDAVLNNIATRRASDLPGLLDISFDDTQSLALAVNVSPSDKPYDYSKALVRQDLTMAPGRQNKVPEFFKFFYPNARAEESIPKSIYSTEYKQISTLGSGGFGRVYLAQYHVDKSEYAIKKIVVKAKRLRQLADRKKVLNDLHSEVKALAKLNHHNIVRYYHCWLETRPSTGLIDNGGDGSDDSDSSGGETDPDVLITGIQSISLGVERDLIKEMTKDRRRASSVSQVLEESKDVVVFEYSASSGNTVSKPSIKPTAGSISGPRQSEGTHSDDDNDNDDRLSSTEEIPRSDMLGQIIPYSAEDEDEDADVDDCLLYIKMTPYPLSLEDCIWGREREQTAGKVDIRHCFHSLPTIRLLLGILDGVEYLHRQKIIHRDLKPANIFLSILPPSEPVTYAYLDMSDCKECSGETIPIQRTYVCPHIGDFGLIHELKDPQTEVSTTPTMKKAALQPFPFSVAASKQAGTKFYVPPKVPKTDPICPRLDVYSLGVIAFEMVYKFGTRSERAIVLNQLGAGLFPKDFENHKLAEGIKAMLHEDRDKRWDCAQVRKWLNEKLQEEK